MAQTRQKLELTWIGKENRPKLEPRVLIEDAEKSYHAAHRVSENDIFDNRLIFGDNLLALKALEQDSPARSSASTSILRSIRGRRLSTMTTELNTRYGSL